MKEIARNEGNNQLNIRKTEVVFLLAFLFICLQTSWI